MPEHNMSRRTWLGATAAGALTAVSINAADLDLTIKEVKVYVLKPDETSSVRRGEQYASIVTNSGIEGNYVLTNRYSHSNWSNLGWLAYAKRALVGKNVLDLPEFTGQFHSNVGQLSYASAMNN